MKALFSLVCVICSCSAQFLDGGISDADIHGTDIQGYAKDFLARYTGANGERFDAVTVLKARQQVGEMYSGSPSFKGLIYPQTEQYCQFWVPFYEQNARVT